MKKLKFQVLRVVSLTYHIQHDVLGHDGAGVDRTQVAVSVVVLGVTDVQVPGRCGGPLDAHPIVVNNSTILMGEHDVRRFSAPYYLWVFKI